MWPDKVFLAAALALAVAGAASPESGRVISARYPEGPLWHDGRLYFAEMRADRVSVVEPQGDRTFFKQRKCGPTAIAEYGEGFLILCHLGARIVAVNSEGREIRRWDRNDAGTRLTDPNDASADGKGGVYFSDPGRFSLSTRPEGWVMHLSADGQLRRVSGPLHYPNGVHVMGNALYVSEHIGQRILRYEIEPDGTLKNKRVFADLAHALRTTRWKTAYPLTGPDGLEFGPDGALYVAIYGEGDLLKMSPGGAILGRIATSTRFLTNIAFGNASVAFTGTFDNTVPPYRGEVSIGGVLPELANK